MSLGIKRVESSVNPFINSVSRRPYSIQLTTEEMRRVDTPEDPVFPETDFTQLKTDRAAAKAFWMKKGVDLNVRDGGRLTGWVGWLLGACSVSNNSFDRDDRTAEEVASCFYSLTAVPGNLLGFASSPARGAHMCIHRKIHYTSEQVEFVHNLLDTLSETGKTESIREVSRLILKAYGKPSFASSKHSKYLVESLRNSTSEEQIDLLKSYLLDRETPLTGRLESVFSSKKSSTNQGKRLFNIIMDVMKEEISKGTFNE